MSKFTGFNLGIVQEILDEELHNLNGRVLDLPAFLQLNDDGLQFFQKLEFAIVKLGVFVGSESDILNHNLLHLLIQRFLLDILGIYRVEGVAQFVRNTGVDELQELVLILELVLQHVVAHVLELDNHSLFAVHLVLVHLNFHILHMR